MMTTTPHRNAFGDLLYSPFDALNDSHLREILQTALRRVCDELGIRARHADTLLGKIWAFDPSTSILFIEAELQTAFAAFVDPGVLRAALDARAQRIASQITKHVLGPSVADIGCGDGMVSWYLRANFDAFSLFDVHNYLDQRVQLPFHSYREGDSLSDNLRVDTSLLLTVLHHAHDPMFLLRSTAQVTRKRIVIIESIYGMEDDCGITSPLQAMKHDTQRKYATFIDWFYNRILHDGVPVPYNYSTPAGWEQAFHRYGWRVSTKVDLGVDQPLVPEYHMLFVIEPGDTDVPAGERLTLNHT
jgi:SAM-dependent methyltransferase